MIKDGYFQLKQKLGRIPRMVDFEYYEELDMSRIFENKIASYYAFLMKYEDEFEYHFNEVQLEMIKYLSRIIANGKRIQEVILLELLIKDEFSIENWKNILHDKYNVELNDMSISTIKNVFMNQFLTGSIKKSYNHSVFMDDHFTKSECFMKELESMKFKEAIIDIIEFSKLRYLNKYNFKYEKTDLCLYQKYTYEDVCRLLNWEQAEVALNIGGYKYDKYSKTYPVLINYLKDEDIADTIKYEDHFLNSKKMLAISKVGRTLQSDDVKTAINANDLGISMHLFVRKNKDDKTSKEFYYLGKINVCETPKEIFMSNTTKTAVELVYELETAVKEDLYDYITGENE